MHGKTTHPLLTLVVLTALVSFAHQILTARAAVLTMEASQATSSVEGNWHGALDVGGFKLRLVLKISKSAEVPAKEDLQGIEQALKDGGNRDYKIVSLPNLNHLFQTSKTGAPSEYAEIEETIAPVALQTIGDWIVAHVRIPAGK